MVQADLIPTKHCKACGVEKPLEQFRIKTANADGLQTKCKPCSNIDVQAWRIRAREARLAYNRAYYRSARGREVLEQYQARYPIKAEAQKLMWNAIASGKLVKPSACEWCGEKRVLDGHHPDYAKPLEIEWLCRPCHKAWHRNNGEGLNAEGAAHSARL